MPVSAAVKTPEAFQQNRLMSFDEARKFLGLGKGSMYKLIASKKDPIPSLKIGRLHKFQLEKLLWWIEKHEQ